MTDVDAVGYDRTKCVMNNDEEQYDGHFAEMQQNLHARSTVNVIAKNIAAEGEDRKNVST